MPNPLAIAAKGKGLIPMMKRGVSILGRYGVTSRKVDAALQALLEVLNEFECPGTFPITASALAGRRSFSTRFASSRIEYAVHGLRHVDHSELGFQEQMKAIGQARNLFEQAGVPVSGFRCPYLRWNDDTHAALRQLGFAYDSSLALAWEVTAGMESDSYRRVLGFYRSQSATRALSLPRIKDGLVCIPYNLPDDEALVERLSLPKGVSMGDVWVGMLEVIHARGELFTLGLHPERAFECRDALKAVLLKARSLTPAVWMSSLSEIAAWWRELAKVSFSLEVLKDGWSRIHIQAPARAAVLVRGMEHEEAGEESPGGFSCLNVSALRFRCNTRPLVGISLDSPLSLDSFLKNQGYLAERSPEQEIYSLYLKKPGFSELDEKAILDEIENVDVPLIRVGRWPDGARCALAVSGDIDAFSLQDYVRRIWSR